MKFNSYVIYIYAVIVIIGGIIGYATAGSIPSIIMGTLFALLLAGSGYLMNKEKAMGRYLAMIFTGLLLIFFGRRYIATQAFLPPGLMSIISLAVLTALFILKNDYKSYEKREHLPD